MVVAKENPRNDVYRNLTESIDAKNSIYESKWTLYLILCCLTVCSASFQFGYNIGATNLPAQLIKDFYGAAYNSKVYNEESYLKTREILPILENFEKKMGVNSSDSSFNITAIETSISDVQNKIKDTYLEIVKIKEIKEIDILGVNGSMKSVLALFNEYKNTSLNASNRSIFKQLRDKIEASNESLWVITNCLFVIGGMIGAFTSKYVLDFLGRKNGILFHNIFPLVGSVLVYLAPKLNRPELVILSRLLFGIQGGMSCGLIPTYLAEISPSALRGATGVCHQLCLTVGILVAQTLGFRQLLGTQSTWHILLALPIIPCIVGSVSLLLFFTETPRALLIDNRDETAARSALSKLRNTSNVSNEIDAMNLEASENTSDEAMPILDLFRLSHLRWPLITSLILQVAQQLCGINAIFFYSNDIFKNATIQPEHIQYAVFATGFINVVCTIVCVPLIDKLGRKPLLVYPMIVIIFDFILLTIFLKLKTEGVIYSYLSIVCIIIFIMSFAVGLGPIPFIYVAECFKQEARSAALGVCMFTNWMANLLLTLSFTFINKLLGDYVFLVFMVIVCIAVVTIFAKVPETKNRTVDEIMDDFEGKKSKHADSEIALRNV